MVNVFVFAVLLSIGLSGAIMHYLVDFLKGHIDCDFIAYCVGEFKRTLGSFGAVVMAALGVMQSGDVDFNNSMVFATMFSAGYMLDSVINKAPGGDQ